ncbi:hypothetical protein JYG23_04745 [Sedimentibacter sp. zth1]|uniref:hypothetical protein n=1 Tax=Sedimentibacter sp. zth1 TaxID=2816908 RepID=UPI001A92052D|nr:hypothetical protein [Sedimentibacter sp. zth1]QSX06758.1 hypothetical protein JYG23_04745 [Sedimentibacter sp. zth1]
MCKSLKTILVLSCIILILGVMGILILYIFNKDSNDTLIFMSKNTTIENLKSTIKQLEEKNEFLSKELETTQLRFKNELAATKFQNEKEKIIEDTFNWIQNHNWNKVTLTNSSGTTIDITDSDIVKDPFYFNMLRTFEFEYYMTSKISKAYKYTFYFDDFSKEITLSNGGFVHEAYMCKNIYLYNVAEALLPLQDELNNNIYTVKQMLLNSKFFSYKHMNGNSAIVSYSQIRYIILEILPKDTVKIDKLPDNINEPTINIKCYYQGKKAYLKAYSYNNIEDYYIELSYEENKEFYKLIDDETPMSLLNIFSAGFE